jgi:hypothetical protein
MSKASIGEIIGGVALIVGALPIAGSPASIWMMATGVSLLLSGGTTGIASLLNNKSGISTAGKNPIGPWGYVYGYQIVTPTVIFEESNNSQGTSNNKELHQVLACACHPCQIGSLGQWQLRINGKIIPMQQSGTGYSGSSSGCTCATGVAVINPSSGQVVAVNITNGGSGYSTAPTVSFSGSGGATAVANISGGSVMSVNITNGGSGYYYGGAPPYVYFSTPDGGVIGAGTTPNGVGYDSYSPTQQSIAVSSIARSSGVVTVHLAQALPNYNGQTALIKNVHDNTYNGAWVLTQPNPADSTTFTYLCGGADGSSSGGTVNTTYPDYSNKIHVEWLDGNHKSTFPGLLASNTSWTANDLCLGRCVLYLRMGYDAAYFPYGPPNVSVVMMGKNDILDTRTSSRGYTNNAALCIADFMSLPPSKGGFGLTIGTDIPSASLTAAANICDETINLAGGGTQKQYTCDTFFQLTSGRGSILQDMLSSCAGRLSFQGGTYQIFPGAWTAPIVGLTDADMYGGMKFRPRLSIRETCNAVKGVYTGQENNWQQADFPPYMQDAIHGYASDAWLAEDRGERIFRDVHLPCTSTSVAAQRLGKIELLRTRYQVRGTVRCSMRAYQLVALDTLTITHARYGWSNKLFEVLSSRLVMEKVENVPTLAVELDVAETDPAVYNWSSTEQLTPQAWREPANAGMQIVSPPEQLTVYSGAANPSHVPPLPGTVIVGADGVARNNLWCCWLSPNDPHVMSGGHLELQWKKSSDTAWASMGRFDPSATQSWLGAVSDGTAYDVQLRAVNMAGVYSDWVGVLGTVVSAATSTINATDVLYSDLTPVNSLKPSQPGATNGATWGTNITFQPQSLQNLILKPTFEDGTSGSWQATTVVSVAGQSFAKALQQTFSLNLEAANSIPLAGATKFYCSAAVSTLGTSSVCTMGLKCLDKNGALTGFAQGAAAAGSLGFQLIYGWATPPAGTVTVVPYLDMSGTGTCWWAQLFIGAYQPGADITLQNTAGNVLTGPGLSVAEPGANVTSAHVLTAIAAVSTNTTVGTSKTSLPGLGFSVTSGGTGDTFNFYIAAETTTSSTVALYLVLDGNTGAPVATQPSAGGPRSSAVFTVTGLSAGSHTFQFYASSTGGIVVTSNTSALCQRIF